MDAKSESATEEELNSKKAPPGPRPTVVEPKDVAAGAASAQPQAAQLLRLPPEILMLILREVRSCHTAASTTSPTDSPPSEPSPTGLQALQNTRLTHRTLASLGLHLLLLPQHPITVAAHPDSLARLESLSRHSVLRGYVRRVRVSTLYYAPRLAGDRGFFNEYVRAKLGDSVLYWRSPRRSTTGVSGGGDEERMSYWEREGLCVKAEDLCDAFLAQRPAEGDTAETGGYEAHWDAHKALLSRAHASYSAYFSTQNTLLHNGGRGGGGAFSMRIAACLQRLPPHTLQHLSFTDTLPAPLDRLNIRFLTSSESIFRVLTAPATWSDAVDAQLHLGAPADAVVGILCNLSAGALPRELAVRVPLASDSGWAPSKAARARVRAVVGAGGRAGGRGGGRAGVGAGGGPGGGGLRAFEYAPQVHPLFFLPRTFDPQVEFVSALLSGGASSLEVLRFEAPEDEGLLSLFEDLISGNGNRNGNGAPRAWPKLRTVSLSRVALRLEDLEAFVKRGCAPELRSVRLQRVKLLSGTWAQVAEVLKGVDGREGD